MTVTERKSLNVLASPKILASALCTRGGNAQNRSNCISKGFLRNEMEDGLTSPVISKDDGKDLPLSSRSDNHHEVTLICLIREFSSLLSFAFRVY